MIRTTLSIEGMACEKCEERINRVLKNAFSIKKVTSSHEKNETVIVSKEALDEAMLKQTVDEMGYKLLDISSEEEKKSLFR